MGVFISLFLFFSSITDGDIFISTTTSDNMNYFMNIITTGYHHVATGGLYTPPYLDTPPPPPRRGGGLKRGTKKTRILGHQRVSRVLEKPPRNQVYH